MLWVRFHTASAGFFFKRGVSSAAVARCFSPLISLFSFHPVIPSRPVVPALCCLPGLGFGVLALPRPPPPRAAPLSRPRLAERGAARCSPGLRPRKGGGTGSFCERCPASPGYRPANGGLFWAIASAAIGEVWPSLLNR